MIADTNSSDVEVLNTFWPGRGMSNSTDASAIGPGQWVTLRTDPDGSVSTVRLSDVVDPRSAVVPIASRS